MLEYLFTYLEKIDFPGAGVFQYISFRSAMTIMTSLTISLIFGKRIIRFLQKKQIGETIRDLGLEGEAQKKSSPTMGGLIILASIVIPVVLFGDLKNVYVILMLITTIWLGFVGFLDDYIKVYQNNKKGLRGKFKIGGQVVLGLIVGLTLHFSNTVVVREKVLDKNGIPVTSIVQSDDNSLAQKTYVTRDVKSTKVNIPFLKNNEFDYSYCLQSQTV